MEYNLMGTEQFYLYLPQSDKTKVFIQINASQMPGTYATMFVLMLNFQCNKSTLK